LSDDEAGSGVIGSSQAIHLTPQSACRKNGRADSSRGKFRRFPMWQQKSWDVKVHRELEDFSTLRVLRLGRQSNYIPIRFSRQ